MQQYMVGNKLLEFTKIIYVSAEGNDNNDGLTEFRPKATVEEAMRHVGRPVNGINPAIVFLPGTYYLPLTYCAWETGNHSCWLGYFGTGDLGDNVTYIGQGKDTIFYCDAMSFTGRATNVRSIVINASSIFYRMWFKINPYTNNHYGTNVACSSWAGTNVDLGDCHQFHNCVFENISATPTSKIFNLAFQGTANTYNHIFRNCIVKSNYTWYANSSYDRALEITNTLLDKATNTTVTQTAINTLVRTITDDDILAGSASDLIAGDGSTIGVYGGDYTWKTNVIYHNMNVDVKLENGIVLKETKQYFVQNGNDFSIAAELLDGYSYIGYRVDGGTLQNISPVVVSNVQADQNVTLVYKEKAATGGGEGVPTGMVMYFADTFAPDGWLECNGRTVSRANYQNLFNVIGTKFGDGDGSSTFNLPDLQGEFIRGFDKVGQIDPNRQFGSKQKATVQAFDPTKTSIYMIGLYNNADDDASKFPGMIGAESIDLNDYQGVAAAGTDSGTSVRDDEVCFAAVRPRNVSLLPCIKY